MAKKYWLICITMIAVMAAMSFRPVQNKFIIRFENYAGDKRLALDTATYFNQSGQAYTVTNFKYYISHISLQSTDGRTYTKEDGYYLIRQDDESTWSIELDGVPEGSYSSIRYMIGVDSLHNCSGTQSGALDPINGMFWTWNSGYIFLKLEGKSPASRQPGHIFEYHIGGYKEPSDFIRTASLAFEKEPLKINPGKTTTLYIKTDVVKILQGSSQIDFAKLSSVTDFHNAGRIADNYQNMFSIIRVSNEW